MQTSKYKIKIVCGYRKEQEFTIDANEAHKAYYLFNNPDKRGTFNNGLAIKGSDIQRIEPDYNATMGYNHTHVLTGDDYNELRREGVISKLAEIMAGAKAVAHTCELPELAMPLKTLLRGKYEAITARTGSTYAQQVLAEGKK